MATAGESKSGTDDRGQPAAALNADERALNEILDYFLRTDDKELLKNERCISSTSSCVDFQLIKEAIKNLEPVMLVEKGPSAIVAFKKPSKIDEHQPVALKGANCSKSQEKKAGDRI